MRLTSYKQFEIMKPLVECTQSTWKRLLCYLPTEMSN